MELHENAIVVKSNKFLDACYKLSAIEQKFILLMASMIHSKDDENFKFYEIEIKELTQCLNLDKQKRIYTFLNELICSLNKKKIYISNGDRFIIINWVASIEHIKGSPTISFEFSERLKPYLLKLNSKFTQFQLKDVMQLKSGYSIRIYELIKQYEKIGNRILVVDDLKNKLGLKKNLDLGIEYDKYSRYNNFKKRVLEVAKKELKAKSNLYFDYEEIKSNKKVIKIKLIIIKKNKIKDVEISKLTKEIEKIENKTAEEKTFICLDIIENDIQVLNNLVKKKLNKDKLFFRKYKSDDDPIFIYEDSLIMRSKINYELFKLYPAQFSELEENQSNKIDKLKNKIKKLKNEKL